MTVPSPAHSVSSNQGHNNPQGPHAPSLPSQSPHNMPQPQPSPQPSQSQQQGSNQGSSVGGRQSVQAEQRSPHQGQQLQYAQQHQHPAQMQHHLQQQMSRYYGQYPNFANLAMSQQQAHLGRLQAAGMASMFPPNPMFNLHPPTTPPKQASSQSVSSR